MMRRRPLFPHVIEMNVQAGRVLGCNVFLVYDQDEWILLDIGYNDTVEEIIELIRQLDFPFSHCKGIVATHADIDHIQGLAQAKHLLKAPIYAHPLAVPPLESGDRLRTFAEIIPQNIQMELPPVKIDHRIDEGDQIQVGSLTLDVWLTAGHTDNQLSFRLGDLLFSGDNIYRDGCVGAIDAHHGSNIPDFIKSLTRIRNSDCEWLLPAHGPMFRRDEAMLDKTIDRLNSYLHMADFGTCATDWPLMDEWEQEIVEGKFPE